MSFKFGILPPIHQSAKLKPLPKFRTMVVTSIDTQITAKMEYVCEVSDKPIDVVMVFEKNRFTHSLLIAGIHYSRSAVP